MCLIASLIVAYVTYRHTQEKRAMLKEQMKIEKDKQSQALIDSAE